VHLAKGTKGLETGATEGMLGLKPKTITLEGFVGLGICTAIQRQGTSNGLMPMDRKEARSSQTGTGPSLPGELSKGNDSERRTIHVRRDKPVLKDH